MINKLNDPERFHDEICEFLSDDIVPEAVKRVNERFSSKQLAKLDRNNEPLPTASRKLSSYRTRLGTMLEYGVATEIQHILEEKFGNEFCLTFAVAHEYPDFYLRDKNLNIILKIEMKAVDADSDEQAAKFDVLAKDIHSQRDFLFIVGWEWINETLNSQNIFEYPHIFAYIFIPAIEIANERDKRLYATGGKIDGDTVLVPSSENKSELVPDKKNYGKFWRIVTRDRRNSSDLTEHVKKFVDFQKEINERAPRNRFSR